MEFLIGALTALYACVGFISAMGYWPTIKDLYFHKRKSANTKSYALWTVSTGISFLYGLFILQDTLFRIVSGMSFIFCATILLLSIRLGRK